MQYAYSITYKTSLSDVFFYETEDNDRFEEWFDEQLTEVSHWSFEDYPEGIPSVNKLSCSLDEFSYDHDLIIRVVVDDGTQSFEELAENDELYNYIDRELSYKIIAELNNICKDITFPMNDGTFDELKFDDNEFFSLLHYSYSSGYFASPRIKTTQFEVYSDFEVVL